MSVITFDRVFSHEFEYENRLLLAISMCSRDGLATVSTHSDSVSRCMYLKILVWIEVRVEDNDSVCTPEVDADSACTCRQNVNKNIRTLCIEEVHLFLSLRLLLVSILK